MKNLLRYLSAVSVTFLLTNQALAVSHDCFDVSPSLLEAIPNLSTWTIGDGSIAANTSAFTSENAASKAAKALKDLGANEYCYFGSFHSPSGAYFVSNKALTSQSHANLTCVSTAAVVKDSTSVWSLKANGKAVFKLFLDNQAQGTAYNVLKTGNFKSACVLGDSSKLSAVFVWSRGASSNGDSEGGTSFGEVSSGEYGNPGSSNNANASAAYATLYSSALEVEEGSSVTLNWSSFKVKDCALMKNGSFLSTVVPGGSRNTGAIHSSSYYTLQCRNLISDEVVYSTVYINVAGSDEEPGYSNPPSAPTPATPTCYGNNELFQGQCVPKCSSGTFRNSFGGCSQSCNSSQELFNGQCVARCSNGTVRNAFGGCSQASCSAHQELFQGQCVSRCPNGTFRNQFGGCSQNCSMGQELFHGQCVPVCPFGTQRNAFGGCQ